MLKAELEDLEPSRSTGLQVTCSRVYPLNRLFEHWLGELASEAQSKEKKSRLSYDRALYSLKLFPSELHSTDEAKSLLINFGDRICAELDKRLEMFRSKYGYPTLENVLCYIRSGSKYPTLPSLVNRNLPKDSPVRSRVSEEDTPRSEVLALGTSGISGTVGRKRRKDYVPRYRSGAYAILRALYELTAGTDGEWLETVTLQRAAQEFCDEYIGPSTRNRPFTAWAARKTLINKNMIEVRRSKCNEYRLTLTGKAMAENFATALGEQRCTSIDNRSRAEQPAAGGGSPGASCSNFCTTSPPSSNSRLSQGRKSTELALSHLPGGSKASAPESEPFSSYDFLVLDDGPESVGNLSGVHTPVSGLEQLRCPECGRTHRVMESSQFHLTLLVDHSETKGGPVGRSGPLSQRQSSRAKMRCALAKAGIRFEERDLSLGDYLWVLQSRSDKSLEFVVDVIIERKRIDDLASSIMGREARYREQKFRLKRCDIARKIYLVEGCDEFASMADYKKAAVRGAFSKTRVIDHFEVVKTANLSQTVDYLKAMTEYVRRKVVLPVWVCADTDGDGSFEEPENGCCRKLMHCMQRFHQFNFKTRKQRPWTIAETFARMLLQFNGISAERAQEILKLYPTAAHMIDVYREMEESSKARAPGEPQQPSPLASVQSGNCKRNIGKASENVDYFFMCDKPFTA